MAARVLSFGSLNIDYVYQVDHIITPGETLDTAGLALHCGGKGLNQSVALARAGADVAHAGIVGADGQMLVDACRDAGVDVSRIKVGEGRSGHTVIQVDASGQNCILLFGGTNRQVTPGYIDEALDGYGAGDVIVVQNEMTMLPQVIDAAHARGMRVVLNPSPYDERIDACDLDAVWLLFVNEVEGLQITGEREPDKIIDRLERLHPGANVVLTLGSKGSRARFGDQRVAQAAIAVDARDTTAAGDTFTGFFLAEYLRGGDLARSMLVAATASSIAVTREGAVPSIPMLDEVLARL